MTDLAAGGFRRCEQGPRNPPPQLHRNPPRPIFSTSDNALHSPQSRSGKVGRSTPPPVLPAAAQSPGTAGQASRACSCQGDPTGTNSGFNDTVPRASSRPSTCHLEGSPNIFQLVAGKEACPWNDQDAGRRESDGGKPSDSRSNDAKRADGSPGAEPFPSTKRAQACR